MLAIKGRISRRHSQKPCPTSKLRSSGALIKPKASPFCPNAGSSSARSRGSTAAEGSPKIGKTSIARRSHSCALLQSASCSENSAIPSNVSGQTLRNVDEMPAGRFLVARAVVVGPARDRAERNLAAQQGLDLLERVRIEPVLRDLGNDRMPLLPPT